MLSHLHWSSVNMLLTLRTEQLVHMMRAVYWGRSPWCELFIGGVDPHDKSCVPGVGPHDESCVPEVGPHDESCVPEVGPHVESCVPWVGPHDESYPGKGAKACLCATNNTPAWLGSSNYRLRSKTYLVYEEPKKKTFYILLVNKYCTLFNWRPIFRTNLQSN